MALTSNYNFISNTVCVMDASTRLGSSLVKRLLASGYTVHAATQNTHDGDHDEFLGPSVGVDACDMKRLKNFHLDPFDYHSIVEALKGCSGLFYSFEPPKDQSCTYDIDSPLFGLLKNILLIDSSFNMISAICVMDASSCLGTRLVKCLLHRGYTVHAARQNYGESSLFLNGLECDDDDDKMKKLKIFQSDPFDYHSIVDALKGCSALFYSFKPPPNHSTYDEYIGEEEVRAAHNVLEACAQTDTIEKVVFTSSATAIIWGHHENDQNSASRLLDERHWSDINFCRKFKLWHALSKTLAEKTAWALAMDRGVNMVSVNAGLLMGPDLTVTNPYLKGAAEMYEDGVFVTVDLDYLVEAHICIYEEISTYGRYLCFNHIINQTEDAVKLANMLSPLPSSPQSWESDTRIIQERISNKKLNKLMSESQPQINGKSRGMLIKVST